MHTRTLSYSVYVVEREVRLTVLLKKETED